VVALPLMMPSMGWRQALRDVFGTPSDDVIEFASLSLGAGVAMVLVTDAPWLLLFALPVLALHRGLQLRQFEHAARRDRDTNLLQAPVWRELAAKQLERARRLGLSVGYLLIRLDAFPAITDRHGPLAGVRVLRAVAETVRSLTRDDDLAGRLPGADLVVLIPGVGSVEELRRIADRVRDAVRELDVRLDGSAVVTTTVSVGGALFPEHATTLNDLLLRADNALFLAKTYGRDQVRLAGPRHVSRQRAPGSPGVDIPVDQRPAGDRNDPSDQGAIGWSSR
jgi:diguanylate cyclase (GGDEF)-like protein